MNKHLLSFHIFLLIGLIDGANILVLMPITFYSHTMAFMPMFKELAIRGHKITMVSPYPSTSPIPNWTDLPVNATSFNKFMAEGVDDFISASFYTFYINFYNTFCPGLMELVYEDSTIQDLIKDEKQKFDLLVIEAFFCQESLVAFGHKLNAPVVAVHPLSISPWPAFFTGNDLALSLRPNHRSGYGDHMTLAERMDNLLINCIEFFVGYFLYAPGQEKVMEKHMMYPGSSDRPSMMNMLKNISLTLIDNHFSVGYAETLQPSTIPVGGMSLKNADPIPEDLKDIMDNARNGVIYLCFGSFVKGNERLLETLLPTFSELDQTVLMKWDSAISNKPKNVIVRKWYPQPSVLAHPNLRLFISHCGLHGTTESMYYGIPLICIPFMSDQAFNSKFVERSGLGTTINSKDFTKDKLLKAVKEVLNNPRYKAAAAERPAIVKDRPLSALNSSIYWIEYVLRHKGAKHLRPTRLDLSLFEILYLDLFLILLLIGIIPFALLSKCIRSISSFLKQEPKRKKD